jgi:hypothetical protein
MNDALFDSYMLSNFPGRTLDELDSMDILRWMRAMDARNIENVEQNRKMQKSGSKKAKDIPKKILKQFVEHDKMFKEFDKKLNGE